MSSSAGSLVDRGTAGCGAVKQINQGQQLWVEHARRPEGVCGGCGRSYPCESAMQAAWLLVYWQPYARQPELVRPYVHGRAG
jgi:hypothetical protein